MDVSVGSVVGVTNGINVGSLEGICVGVFVIIIVGSL